MSEKYNFLHHKFFLALMLFLLSFSILYRTYSDYGLAWDEPYNLKPAVSASNWLNIFYSNPVLAASNQNIDQYWSPIHEHPSISKFIAAYSYSILSMYLDNLPSFRLGEILFFSIFLVIFFISLDYLFNYEIALFSSLTLLFLPRIFAQIHFATTDAPMMIMAFFTTICFYKGLNSWRWSIVLGFVWGLALSTKINALFLPIPLIVWAHIFHRNKWGLNAFCMLFLSPIIFVLSWPWLWHHTFERIFEYLQFYTGHKFTTVYYFGTQYNLVPAPWHYPWVYTFITLPILTIFLVLLGIFSSFKRTYIYEESEDALFKPVLAWNSNAILFIFMGIFPILFQSLPNTPRYDGIRLFLPAFPFLAGLAGLGFAKLYDYLKSIISFLNKNNIYLLLFAFFLLPPVYCTLSTHPYQLSYYNLLVGGESGAKKLGLESTYWCESLNQDAFAYINKTFPPNAKVQFLSFGDEVLQLDKDMGLIRSDIDCFSKTSPDYYVLQIRQGFFSRQEWYLYHTLKPMKSFSLHGVPLLNIYPAHNP